MMTRLGREGIVAKMVADSKTRQGKRIMTFELTYPRFIHSELMTHRVFSRNAMSSRAVPISAMLAQVCDSPAMPVEWGKNQPGMQAKELLSPAVQTAARHIWLMAAENAANAAQALSTLGAHKQIANRLLEPFQMMRTIITATEWNNFFWLRVDKDADPNIKELAEAMYLLAEDHKVYTETLAPGDYHTPYVEHVFTKGIVGSGRRFEYATRDENNQLVFLSLEDALSISSSCCAQVSYRRLDATKDKAMAIYGRLLSGNKVHASPFEHIATPMNEQKPKVFFNGGFVEIKSNIGDGVTHIDLNGDAWSGNFCGWEQWRQLLPNNVKKG